MEKEMATHSSILAWRIPWTEEPGGLPSWVYTESDTTKHACKDIQGNSWGLILNGRVPLYLGFPDSSVGKEPACNAGDPGSIPGSGRSPGEGKDYQL